jgi:hypothetical protein
MFVGLSDIELQLRMLVARLVLSCLQVGRRCEELGFLSGLDVREV